MRILKCKKCGNIITIIKEGTCIPKCCGDEMTELKANEVDAAVEKHVPVIKKENNKVTLTCGETLHPMEEKHYIEFMAIETTKGVKINYLNPGEEPITVFELSNEEELIRAYAYCNLHGLWTNK